jgi:hypothetical protein
MDLATARVALDRERARLRRAAEPRIRPPYPNDWRPTPTPYEANLKAANPSNIVLRKVYDRSPIDPSAFDPTPGPSPGPPPTCTIPPNIVALPGLAVGDTLAGSTGAWSGSPTYTRQWFRGSTPIAGETSPGYVLATADVGQMIGFQVIGSNPNGAVAASADPVGPITETLVRKADDQEAKARAAHAAKAPR